jgi:hypothetical protein
MSVAEIENQLEQMSNNERLIVIEIATKLLQNNLNIEQNDPLAEMRSKLKRSAEIMESEYLNNEELTAVTRALEYEDFLDD